VVSPPITSVKALVETEFATGTIYYRKWDLENIIVPTLGAFEVQAITPKDIVNMLDASKRSWTTQKRILTSTKKLFDHAVGKQIITNNPCLGINLKALLGPRPPVRRRVMLSEEELRVLLADIDYIGTENALAFRVLLATCVRSIELVKAKWEHIDFDKKTWWVPDESVKTRKGFLVPLTPTVADWFRSLRDLAGETQWVLPGRTERRHRQGDNHVGKTTLWASVQRAFMRGDIEIRRFTPHDTRSTAKGHVRNMGISREISEIALNHTLKGMEAIYDVREDIPERRAALEQWATFIVACENGTPWTRANQKTNFILG